MIGFRSRKKLRKCIWIACAIITILCLRDMYHMSKINPRKVDGVAVDGIKVLHTHQEHVRDPNRGLELVFIDENMINTSTVNKTVNRSTYINSSVEHPDDAASRIANHTQMKVPGQNGTQDHRNSNVSDTDKDRVLRTPGNQTNNATNIASESVRTYNCSKGGNPYCLQSPVRTLHQPRNPCENGSHIELMLIITSSPVHFEIRNVIRQTWAMVNESNIGHLFTLGRNVNASQEDIDEEQRAHGDLLQGDFIDSYRNLTFKTIMAYAWFRKHCPQAPYVMKTDDDMFVNTPHVVKFAQTTIGDVPTMTSYCTTEWMVPAYFPPGHRWYMPKDMYPDEQYPPYCCGCGYVISGSVARDIADVMPWLPLLVLEDVFAGLAVSRLNYSVAVVHQPTYFPSLDIYYPQGHDMFCKKLRNGTILFLHHIDFHFNKKLFNCIY